MPTSNAISVSQLHNLVGTPKCPVIIDVRISEDFDDDPRIIPGAIKRDFDNITGITAEFANQKVVIYCQKGFKISQGTAALLRQNGIDAWFLVGGQFAWRDAKLPMIKILSITRSSNESASLWVTCDSPKVGGMACAWLIKRFLDPQGKILFVEPSQVMNVADRFNAIAFDVANGPLTHNDEHSYFYAMLEEFGLITSNPLKTLAHLVDAATNQYTQVPEAAGLVALSAGLSCMYEDDEAAELAAGMLLYDAYYCWARAPRLQGCG